MNVSYLPKKIVANSNKGTHLLHRYSNTHNQEEVEQGTFSLIYILQAITRNLLLGLVLVPLGAAIFFLISKTIVPVYKSPAILNIQSSYFRGPLVSDLIPEEHDRSELLSRRDSLIRHAISDEFILSLFDRFPALRDELGVDAGVVEIDEKSKALAITRFRDHIEYFNLAGSTYHMTFMSSSPALTQRLTQALLDRVMSELVIERKNLLRGTREAISTHVRELAGELSAIEQSLRVTDEKTLSDELKRTRADLETLLIHYTEKHPKVSELRRATTSLENRLRALQQSSVSAHKAEVPRSAAAKEPTQDVYNELLKKLSFIQISLSLEEEDSTHHLQVVQSPLYPLVPFFPNPLLFLSLGAIFGGIFWIIITTIREITRDSIAATPVESLAYASDVLYLGKFPEYHSEMNIKAHPENGADSLGGPESSGGVVLPHKRIRP